MKKVLLTMLAGVGLVVLVLVVNTLRAGGPATPPAAVGDEANRALADVDAASVAGHLGEAIRFETISVTGEAHANVERFRALHRWLQSTYPSAHAHLDREVVNGESLLYTWPGSDPTLPPVAFLAHMDVVPVEAATLDEWTHPPFGGVVDDGFVWGRGALDMKSTLVTLMEAAEILIEAGIQPERTVYLAFGHDEEVGGGAGAGQIAQRLAERGVRLGWLLDEGGMVVMSAIPGLEAPIAMVAVAEKGYLTLEIVASGEGGHSSTPPAETAVGRLARALVALEAAPFPASINVVMGEMIERIGSQAPFPIRLVTANRWLFDPVILAAISGDRTFVAMARTTTAPTMLEASPKENVLASRATARVNFRVIPGETVESVAARVRSIVGDDGIEVRVPPSGSNPSAVASTDNAAFKALERSVARLFPDAILVPGLLMAGTDSRQYADVVDNAYRFAAVRIERGDVSRFHGTDERVPVASLGEMVQFYTDLIGSGLGEATP